MEVLHLLQISNRCRQQDLALVDRCLAQIYEHAGEWVKRLLERGNKLANKVGFCLSKAV